MFTKLIKKNINDNKFKIKQNKYIKLCLQN